MVCFAQLCDADAIREFIDKYWKKDHILSRDEEFFRYMYCGDGKVDFVISKDENGNINGILGYIPYGLEEGRDVMLALWQVVNPTKPMLGVVMLKYLMKNINAKVIASLGLNMKTSYPIYEMMGYHVGKLKQWYRLSERAEYKIASVSNDNIPYVDMERQYKLIKINDYIELEEKFDFEKYKNAGIKPYKEPWYIRRRYFEHPIYQYQVYGVVDDKDETDLIIVVRKEPCNGTAALRLVDCIGCVEKLKYIGKELDRLLMEVGAEYIDMYEIGVSDDVMTDGGWLLVESSGNIIPNYFAPYECKNVDITFFTTDENIVLFKGDGDQDRPS